MRWERYERKEGVLKGWEAGESYATMLNVSQSNKGYRAEAKKKKKGGARKCKVRDTGGFELPPPAPLQRFSLL